MTSDDYQMQHIYRYTRKSFKKNRQDESSLREKSVCIDDGGNESPRSVADWGNFDPPVTSAAACTSCGTIDDKDIASILHKKCPVISLAEQQLQRLLEGTEKLLGENDRACRSVCDFLFLCKQALSSQNKAQCVLIVLIGVAFLIGTLLGAASCGSYLGRFESPILHCIDSYFAADTYPTIEESFRSIV